MCVDIVNRVGLETGVPESMLHGKVGPVAVFSWCSHVVGVTGKSIAREFGVDSRSSPLRMFKFLIR
jgi:hypothetical protein